jgi:hypothetical protein
MRQSKVPCLVSTSNITEVYSVDVLLLLDVASPRGLRYWPTAPYINRVGREGRNSCGHTYGARAHSKTTKGVQTTPSAIHTIFCVRFLYDAPAAPSDAAARARDEVLASRRTQVI